MILSLDASGSPAIQLIHHINQQNDMKSQRIVQIYFRDEPKLCTIVIENSLVGYRM